MMRLLAVLGVLWGYAVCDAAQPSTALKDPLTNPAWVHFYNNEYDQAIEIFNKEIETHPDDATAYNNLAQGILYREMFRNGALESEMVTGSNPFLRREKVAISPQDKARFQFCIQKAIELSGKQLAANPKDVMALYASGVAHGLRSNYLFLVEKAWFEALREATASRKANNQITEIDPTFVDARLVEGVHDYIVGSLPFYMKALGFLAGFHGDREGGVRQIQEVAKHGIQTRYDAEVILAAIYRREHKIPEALALLKECAARFPRNYLFRMEQVQMYSDAGNKEEALQVLAEVEQLHRSGSPGFKELPEGKIEYARGNLRFWYRDLDLAVEDLKAATQHTENIDLNTEVMSWMRLGQTYDLKHERTEAVAAYRRAVDIAPQSEVAEEARGYIDKPYRRKH